VRRLVVCCDGTWNDENDQTNVWKISQVLARTSEQPEPYDDPGVGADWGEKLSGGIIGNGLSKNIRQAYEYLVKEYQDGDEIYLFGFSRGAFTVRSLVGFIRAAGLLQSKDAEAIDEAFEQYREADAEDADPLQTFRTKYNVRKIEDLHIQFLGVWDTVGALGVPAVGPRSYFARRRWKFHDYRLSSYVKHAYHALAIDEKRTPFLAALWTERGAAEADSHDEAWRARVAVQKVEQVWFSGSHSDVGGRPGRLAFHWMVGKVRDAGLEIDADKLKQFPPDNDGVQGVNDSLSAMYRIPTGGVIRPVCAPQYASQSIDPSALTKRTQDPGYDPENLRWLPDARPMSEPRPIHTRWYNRVLQRRFIDQYEDEGRESSDSPATQIAASPPSPPALPS